MKCLITVYDVNEKASVLGAITVSSFQYKCRKWRYPRAQVSRLEASGILCPIRWSSENTRFQLF
uniref:HTH_OrfB_IS605 domain-containing protein n=1 Tax=Heterorhabditis bacteriophora TaxID=37862 RepID=A0A1I7WPT7_HETBA